MATTFGKRLQRQIRQQRWAFLSVLPMVFQFVDDYKLLFYSALLFFMMRFSPEGLYGLVEKINKNRKSKLDKENKNEQKAS